MKNNIYVQDNFFEKEFFKKLQKELYSLEFKSRYKEVKNLSKQDNENNTLQRNYHHVTLEKNTPVVLETLKNIKKNFNCSVKKSTSYYLLSFPNTPPIPHNDVAQFNCLIYLLGDKLINNGTGFYEKLNDKYELHTHIGFKENRAIFFDSKIFHSPLQWAGNSTPRYVMANFLGT